MKTLVVYYSRTNFTKRIAEILAEKLGADIEILHDTKNRQGALGYLSAGRDAGTRRITKLEETKTNLDDYEMVVVGTPIWSWNVTPAVRTYLRHKKGKFKKVAFFSTMSGSGNVRAYADMAKECGIEPVATLGLLTKEVAKESFGGKLDDFIKKLV